MTRFLFTTKTKVGCDTVRLKSRLPWLAEADATKITDMVGRARQLLSLSIAAIISGNVNAQFARTYFLADPTADEWRRIHAILELTYNGLNSDVTLKLGADGHDGFVRGTVFWTGPGECEVSHRGHTIHVNKKSILKNANRGVIIIMHEACHKYANTDDYGRRGYRLVDDSDWAAGGLTKAEALDNADSYAHFAYHQGASMGA